MSHHSIITTPTAFTEIPSAPKEVATVARLGMRTLSRWRARARQRHDLRNLDVRLLEDIGVTLVAAQAEANKSFWV
jgi:uncharacterized protein YjiS (DUF1127 family)